MRSIKLQQIPHSEIHGTVSLSCVKINIYIASLYNGNEGNANRVNEQRAQRSSVCWGKACKMEWKEIKQSVSFADTAAECMINYKLLQLRVY